MSQGQVSVGHPVDVGSGAVFTLSTDFVLPGSVGLRWTRHYSTIATYDTWLGRKWTVPYFMSLTKRSDGYVLAGSHGEETLFPTQKKPEPGTAVSNLQACMELRYESGNYTVLHWHQGKTDIKRFGFRDSDQARLNLTWIENLAGHRIRLNYDKQGCPISIIQELEQRTIEIEYDFRGLVAAVHFLSPRGRRTLVTYSYDDGRRLIAAVDAAGYRKLYEYDSENRMTAETSPSGSKFLFQYDRRGRCIHTAGQDGFLERKLQYFSAPPMTRVTDTRGGVTQYYLNPSGQVVQIVSPSGGVTTNTFDEHGRLAGVVRPDGSKESYAYDNKGNRASAADPCGAAAATEHTDSHLPVKQTDRNGNVWALPAGRGGSLLGVEDLAPSMWHFRWGEDGLVTSARRPGGRILTIRRDARLGWQERHDQISLVHRMEFDEFGYPVLVADQDGIVTQTSYDGLHRPLEIRDRTSGVTSLKWSPTGRMAERIRPGGQRETWEYDPYGHTIAQTNSLGATARFEHDKEGKLTAVTNRVGERLEYTRDVEGRVVREKFFDGRVQTYEYNLAGRRAVIHLSDGRSIIQKFDPAGRLVSRKSSDGLHDEFEYDKEGRVVKAWNGHSAVELKRDRAGRIVAEIQNRRRVDYRYDRDGNRLSRALPLAARGAKLTRAFDIRGRLVALSDEQGPSQEFQWDHRDRIVERRGPGVIERLAYDEQGRVQEQSIQAGNGQFARRYRYDASGNVADLEDSRRGPLHFTYDAADRLTEVRTGSSVAEAYEYDANGTICRTHKGRRTIAAGGRTIQDGSREISYAEGGAIGTIQSGTSTQSLRHDVNGRLVEVVQANGAIVRYEYDPFGRRTAKTAGAERIEFLWEGWTLAAEIRDGEAQNIFAHSDLRPLAQWQGQRRLTPILDRRGAVREVFDESGQTRWDCVLDAYGGVASEKGDVPNPFRLRGQYQDPETGLHYNFNRHYDPVLGDYTAPDPIGIAGGHHFYAYPRNPLRWDDPFGLECGDPEQHEPPDEDPNETRGGPGALADPPEDGPPGLPRLGQQEGQDIVDTIHGALGDIAARNSVTTLTETEDGSLIVTNSKAVTPAMRQTIAEMQEPGQPLDGRTVLVPDDRHNPGYIPNQQRNLPPQGADGNPTGAENHGEQRGIQAANYYDQYGDGDGQRHGPADSQWSTGEAGHQGQACPHCAAAQQNNNVYNPTGVDPNP